MPISMPDLEISEPLSRFLETIKDTLNMTDENRTVFASITADHIAGTESVIFADATAGNIEITLLNPFGTARKVYKIIKTDSSANTVTLVTEGSVTINGAATYVLSQQYENLTVVNDKSNYYVSSYWNNGFLSGDEVVYDDFRFPAISGKAGVTSPTWTKIADDGAGSLGVFTWVFADGIQQLERLHFIGQSTHAYKEGTNAVLHVHHMPLGAGAGTIKWNCEFAWINVNATLGNTTLISATETVDGDLKKHLLTDAVSEIPGTGKKISAMFMLTIHRDPGDTFADDSALLEVDLHIQLDALGSANITSKT